VSSFFFSFTHFYQLSLNTKVAQQKEDKRAHLAEEDSLHEITVCVVLDELVHELSLRAVVTATNMVLLKYKKM